MTQTPISRAEERQKWWWFAVGALILLLLYYLSPVLTPFVMAGVLAYICLPMVEKLSRRRVPRPLAVILVIILVSAIFIVLLLVILPMLIRQGVTLAQSIPGWLDRLNQEYMPWINGRLGTDIELDAESIKETVTDALKSNEEVGEKAWATLRMGGLGLLGLFANLVLVPVVMFFLLRDWHSFIARFEQLIPRGWHDNVLAFFREADHALGQYLHGQVLVLLVMSVFYTVGLWITGLDYFLPIGVVTGLLTFIPFVGATVGFVLATLSGLMQFDDSTRILWVWGVFFLGQAIEGNFVTPR
ncbi:MAG TPA: AI-2E family transporter, partial [Burkholderiales bacterium]|nr:AI-2E family transporter [Burkholderiales bacterium]